MRLNIEARSFSRLAKRALLQITKLGKGRAQRISENTKKIINYTESVANSAQHAMKVEKKRACKTANRKIEMIKNEIKEDLEKAHKVVNQARLLIEQKPCLELNSVKQVSIPTKGKKRHIDSDKPFFSMD